MLRTDYLLKNRRSTKRLEGSVKHLQAYFGTDRAVDIDAVRIKAYVKARIEQGAANATVDRELAAAKHAFKIAVGDERLSRAPKIDMLAENNKRRGFVEHAEFKAVRDALPERLRDAVSFLYLSGWRVSEMKTRGLKILWSESSVRVRVPPPAFSEKGLAVASIPDALRISEIVDIL